MISTTFCLPACLRIIYLFARCFGVYWIDIPCSMKAYFLAFLWKNKSQTLYFHSKIISFCRLRVCLKVICWLSFVTINISSQKYESGHSCGKDLSQQCVIIVFLWCDCVWFNTCWHLSKQAHLWGMSWWWQEWYSWDYLFQKSSVHPDLIRDSRMNAVH